jgi:hypothetical protein
MSHHISLLFLTSVIMAAQSLTFYTSALCPYAERCAILLGELGTPHEVLPIDLRNKPAWYMAINPKGKVPALKVTNDAGVDTVRIPNPFSGCLFRPSISTCICAKRLIS